MDLLVFLIGFFGFIGAIIALIKKAIKKEPKKKTGLILGLCLVLMVVGLSMPSSDDKNEEAETGGDQQQEVEEKISDEKNEFDITGDLNIEFKDGKAIATITTNAADGSIFETSLTDGNFNMVSDFISIEDGEGVKEFEVLEEWEFGYISGISTMRFNLEEHPQPDNIKELYGENGEKLKGEFAEENNLGGYNINLKINTVPYPDEVTVKEKMDQLFTEALNELINASEGIIVKIQPHFTDGDWSSVAITVSDAWYNSEEYEKERFAEQLGNTVGTIIKNTGKVDGEKSVSVYFYDTYGKELATPKITGGYKIKK